MSSSPLTNRPRFRRSIALRSPADDLRTHQHPFPADKKAAPALSQVEIVEQTLAHRIQSVQRSRGDLIADTPKHLPVSAYALAIHLSRSRRVQARATAHLGVGNISQRWSSRGALGFRVRVEVYAEVLDDSTWFTPPMRHD